MQDSIWEKTLISFFTSNPLQVADALGDCKKLTTLISHSFAEGLVMMMQQKLKVSGVGYSIIRNAMANSFRDEAFIKHLDDALGDTICTIYHSIADNFKKFDLGSSLSPSNTPK